MKYTDALTEHYSPLLEGNYDCMDRIVLNAYCKSLQIPGGFRLWYRDLCANEDRLTTAGLMRFAGRMSRRVQNFCRSRNIPLVHFKTGERKHEVAEDLMPKTTGFTGIFAVFVSRAPAKIWEVVKLKKGGIFLRRKNGLALVNHYYFHILDREWGHLTIRMSAHPSFNCQIILNGHEWVERRKAVNKLNITKTGNCFTGYNDGDVLSKVADTLKQKGQLEKVCDRWIYRCLWFALNYKEQESTRFRYSYSVYQIEYSRNLLFQRGHQLEIVYQNIIDLTRRQLTIKDLKTIFGVKNRPYYRKKKVDFSGLGVRVETPDYNLTVFKIHFKGITLKLYDKGERTLRSEVVVHNAKALKCKRGLDALPQIVDKLKSAMLLFMNSLKHAHVALIHDGDLENLVKPTQKGSARIAGVNVFNQRLQDLIAVAIAFSVKPDGFTITDIMGEMKYKYGPDYSVRQAAYDLRKLRGKALVEKIKGSHRYYVTSDGLSQMVALLFLVKQDAPKMLSAIQCQGVAESQNPVDQIYFQIASGIQSLQKHHGLSIAA